MRLTKIALTWFRGAAECVELETPGKSVVVYGPNASGKSSFVDGVEYLISSGKIGHLANEYSGRRLENAVINTQIPERTNAKVELHFGANTTVSATIRPDGAATYSGVTALSGWRREQIILRQDEVSAFVQADKAEKYSSILPLIGLGPLELVATNVRNLRRRVENDTAVQSDRRAFAELSRQWKEAGVTAVEAGERIKALYSRLLPGTDLPSNLELALAALRPVVNARIESAGVETKQHFLLATIRDVGLGRLLADAVAATEATSRLVEPLLSERLTVLRAAEAFVTKVDGTTSVTCPSCGQTVEVASFRSHVEAEKARLESSLSAFETRHRALGSLLDGLHATCMALRSDELRLWSASKDRGDLIGAIQLLMALDTAAMRLRPDAVDLGELSVVLPPLIAHIEEAASTAPPEAQELVAALKLIEAVAAYPKIKRLNVHLRKIDNLIAFLVELESQVRDEIRLQTETVISGISVHIRRMWNRLHPAARIDGIRLYQPDDAAKAIDIELNFYGRTQPSPRLSLSEGDRHSLGMCIFLSLAKESSLDRPILLDDIVTSLDREHRSHVLDLLVSEFSDRQILLFTHEQDWFVELSHQLPAKQWEFKVLQTFDTPGTGIRWSSAPVGFANARILLDVAPNSAANFARGLMDLHMALVAERLALPVPFIRGARNDQRNALELLERFISRARKQLRRKGDNGSHEYWEYPVTVAHDLRVLLISWGNPGSHGRYITRPEAEKLIAECEKFLDSLRCSECGTHISYAAVVGKHLRCDCDSLRWII